MSLLPPRLSRRVVLGSGAAFLVLPSCNQQSAAPPAATLEDKVRLIETSLTPPSRLWNPSPAQATLERRMDHHHVPGVSIALIENHSVVWAKGYGERLVGSGEAVNTETVFSVGSLSKIGTAMIALRMIDAGLLDLDEDVNTYLKSWKVPYGPEAQNERVTLRRLMSHTAGLNVSGFADFGPEEETPTTVEILNGSGPAKNRPVRIIHEPGSIASYSGGGTTVTQLIVEDVTSQPFAAAARRYVLDPLGMARSTYKSPLPSSFGNIASAHGRDGGLSAAPRGWHSFPETAASGLWTTPSDYAHMLIALVQSYLGRDGSFVSNALARTALTRAPSSKYGLGPVVNGAGDNLRISHTGSNEAYKARFDYYPHRGDGLVVATNGTKGGQLREEIRNAAAHVLGWPEPHDD